jgi:hypothetical protein
VEKILATSGQLRVMETMYEGARLIDVRRWYRDAEDVLRPTKRGISIRREEFPAFVELMQEALKQVECEEVGV